MQKRIPNPKLLIVIFLAIIVIVPIAILISHFISHGRLTIVTDLNVINVSLFADRDDHYDHSFDGNTSGDIPTGHYLVQVSFSDNQLYSEEVTINGFSATTTITVPDLPTISYTKVLDSTLGGFLPLYSDTYLSFFPFLGSQVVAGDTVQGFTPISVHDAYFNSNGVMLSSSVYSGQTTDDISFYYYNSSSRSNTHIATRTVPSQLTASHGQDGFYLIDNRTLYSFTPLGSTTTLIPDNITYSMNFNTPITAKNSTHIAFLDGNDYFGLDPDGTAFIPTDQLESTNLHIYPIDSLTDDSQKITIPLDKSNDIYAISISPSSKHIAVFHDTYVRFYSVSTGKHILSARAAVDLNNLIWTTDDQAIFLDDLKFQLANLSEQTVSTILAPNQINVSQFCGLKDNILYFTAFEQGNTKQSLPAGYYADLSSI